MIIHYTQVTRCFILSILSMFSIMASDAQSYTWANALGGTEGEIVNASVTDKNNNVYICGSFSGSPDFDPSAGTAILTGNGSLDMFLAKYDKDGKFLWAVSMGGSEADNAYNLAVDPDNNICMTGIFRGTVDFDPSPATKTFISEGENDIFLCKFNAAGQLMWVHHMGGPKFDQGQDLGTDSLGNIYVTGDFSNGCTFGKIGIDNPVFTNGASDIFFAKYDKNGKYIWVRFLGADLFDFGYRIAVNPGGDFYVSGTFTGRVDFDPFGFGNNLQSDGQSNIFITAYDKNGEYKWATKLGGISSESVTGLETDATGKVYICGNFTGKGDFDPSPDSAYLQSAGQSDIFLAAYDKNGEYLWAESAGGINEDNVQAITAYKDRIYLCGYFRGITDLEPGSGTTDYTSAGETDMFISAYDTSGRYITSTQMGGTDYDFAQAIAADKDGDIYLSGYFRGIADMDPSAATKPLTVAGEADVFLAKYGPAENTAINTFNATSATMCYPNPSSGGFYIHCSYPGVSVFANIYNSLGILICTKELDTPETFMTLSQETAGLYFISISDNGMMKSSHTIIKQ